MDCLIGEFIKKFLQTLDIAVDFKELKDIKLFILEKLKKNQNSSVNNYRNKFELISDVFFNINSSNDRLERTKKELIISLLLGKKIHVDNEYNKIISYMDKNILIIRQKIMKLIKDNTYCLGEDEPLNEIMFFDFIKKIKIIIKDFISKYNVNRIKYDDNIFNNILKEYKSFNLESLNNLYEYLSHFFQYYRIYNLFTILINDITKIIKNNKINININYIYNLMDDNVHFICLHNEILNNKIEKMERTLDEHAKELKEFKKMNDNISLLNRKVQELTTTNLKLNQKINNLKGDIKKEKMLSIINNNELTKIKSKLNSISEHLLCPISQEIMNEPVISPYGNTYDEKSIKDWLIKNNNDPLTRQVFAENQLIKNHVLKDIIEEFKK